MTESIRNSGVLEIRDRLSSISGGRILDVGTQHGDFIETMMKAMKDYKSIIGIDISEKDLDKAREAVNDESATFELMNAEELTFDDESFDTVSLSYSIHHLENVDIVLSEMMRVLKPGGHMIIQEMYSDGNQSDAQRTETLIHHLDARLDRMEGTPHYDTYSRQQLKDFVNGLGLSSIEVFGSSWGLKCLYCDNSLTCEDPRGEYNMKFGREEIEELLQRAKALPGADDILHEAELLLERIETTGHHSASILFFICEK
jgi:2-polyprenyl-3-methyl-5-hydroxy-6-metoxy-1,4-benzoquinol methylase